MARYRPVSQVQIQPTHGETLSDPVFQLRADRVRRSELINTFRRLCKPDTVLLLVPQRSKQLAFFSLINQRSRCNRGSQRECGAYFHYCIVHCAMLKTIWPCACIVHICSPPAQYGIESNLLPDSNQLGFLRAVMNPTDRHGHRGLSYMLSI